MLCLWCRPAATALIGPLAWELTYAVGVALEKTKRQKKKKEKKGLIDANCCFWNGLAMRSCCVALGTMSPVHSEIRTENESEHLPYYFFFVFLPFLGPLPQHMEVPRLGVQSEL